MCGHEWLLSSFWSSALCVPPILPTNHGGEVSSPPHDGVTLCLSPISYHFSLWGGEAGPIGQSTDCLGHSIRGWETLHPCSPVLPTSVGRTHQVQVLRWVHLTPHQISVCWSLRGCGGPQLTIRDLGRWTRYGRTQSLNLPRGNGTPSNFWNHILQQFIIKKTSTPNNL